MSRGEHLKISRKRLDEMLRLIEDMATGDTRVQLPVSPDGDELDALSFAINVLAGEVRYAQDSALEAQKDRARAMEAARDRALEADRQKTLLLRNVSHELRTPLTAILAAAELLQHELEDGKARELASRITSNGRALVALVGDILDLSKVEDGHLKVELGAMDPTGILSQVVRDLFPEAERKGIKLSLQLTGLPPAMQGDARRTRQILVNVVGNAIKYTDAGEVLVRARGSSTHLVVEVVDTGLGVVPQDRDTIFEPLARTSAPRRPGSGLGLAIAHRMAEGMDGKLELVDSQPGLGSTFRLTLPLGGPVVMPISSQINLPALGQGMPLHGLKVLLVEDDEDIRDFLCDAIGIGGALVTTARDGASALRCVTPDLDVILMDLHMPVMNGVATTQALRDRGVTTPIIALTAELAGDAAEQFRAAGGQQVIAKPVALPELQAELSRLRKS